jgi:predicted kinase
MQAIIFMGIQATGKSTFYAQRFANTHVRINLDMLKTRHREQRLFETCLEVQQPLAIDNTNPTLEDRQRYLIPVKQHKFEAIGYYFESKAAEAILRNSDRPAAQQIPEKGIRGTRARLVIPSYAEGFDQLYFVRIAASGEFIVEDWAREI